MDFTGERFIPGAGLDGELEIEHYQRYQAVRDLITNKVVLDAASGEGYGSELLARKAKQVYGLEIDPEAVRQAQGKYQHPNLTFTQGTIAALPFLPATFDAAISFETIEHVTGDLQESFIKEIKRVLKPDGFFLISTPDKRIYSDLAHYHNEFHTKEFYRQEFHDFLSQHFTTVKFWEQSALLAYVLTDGQEDSSLKLMQNGTVEGKYIIALCSDTTLPEPELGSITLDTEDRYRRTLERVIELQDEIEEKNKHIQIVLNDIDICEKTIKKQEQTLKESVINYETIISTLHEDVTKSQQQATEIEALHTECTTRLKHIESTKAWRLIQTLYRIKNRIWNRNH